MPFSLECGTDSVSGLNDQCLRAQPSAQVLWMWGELLTLRKVN